MVCQFLKNLPAVKVETGLASPCRNCLDPVAAAYVMGLPRVKPDCRYYICNKA